MTDSASWRRRRRGGRHQEPIRRSSSRPSPPETARRNRAFAFGQNKRTWLGSPTPDSPDPERDEQGTGPDERRAGGVREQASPASPAPEPREGRPEEAAASGEAPAGDATAAAPPPRRHGRRARRDTVEQAPAPAPLPRRRPERDPSPAAGDAGSDAWAGSAAPTADSPSSAGTVPTAPTAGSPASADPEPERPTADRGPESITGPAAAATAAGVAAASPGAPGPRRPLPSRRRSASPSPAASSPAPASPASPDAAPEAAGASRAEHARRGRPGLAARDASPASPGSPGDDVPESSRAAAGRDRPGRRRRAFGIVALWTLATSVLPGIGLITTKLRPLGWALLGLIAAAVLGLGAWFLLGDPLTSGIMLLTRRSVLITLLVVAVVAALVWAGQIVLTSMAQSTRQRLRGRPRVLALVLAAVLVAVGAVPAARGVQSIWATQGLLGSDTVFAAGGTSPLGTGEDPWEGVGRINILLLGQDSGEDRTGTRPDTLMVASIDTETGSTALFSIPRNLENVRFPEGTVAAEEFPEGFDFYGSNQNLINAVWTWADEHEDLFEGEDAKNPGLTATTWAVEETLGLEMDYYAMVNLQGFEDLVDAIGGVEMVVERRIPIGGGTNQATGEKYPIDGYIEPGLQTLDGYHALWYARSREGSDDFDRMCRQQRMVRVVAQEANVPTLAMSIPGLVTATEENIQTDIPVGDLDAVVVLAQRIQEAGFTSYPITQDVTHTYDADWDHLKEWTQESIDESMESVEAEDVTGETEPGSTEPAETGTTEEETTAEETTEEATTEAESPEETTAKESAEAEEENPLESCLPGAGEEG